MSDLLRYLKCFVLGHEWNNYFYPRTDGWFSAPHHRRECLRCARDEARTTA